MPLPLDAIPEHHLHKQVEDMVKRNGFKNPRYVVESGSDAGDNFLSLMYRVLVEEQQDGARARRLQLMCKCALQSRARREALRLDRVFRNETNFYDEVLPAYASILGGLYSEVPRCYLSSVGDGESDMLVLEDMRAQGFAMLDRLRDGGVDERHARAVLLALARLHGCSLAAELLRPAEFARLRAGITESLLPDSRIMQYFQNDVVSSKALGIIVKRFPEESKEYKIVKELCAKASEEVLRSAGPCPDGRNALCHGDVWTNNILFKNHEDPDELPKVCFVDFQMSRYASPVTDLVYFVYTCMERKVRDLHLDSLQRDYLRELHARMRVLGVSDPDAVYSWDCFQAHWKRFARFGFITTIVVLPFFLIAKEEIQDLNALYQNGRQEMYDVKSKNATVHEKRVCDTLEEMVKSGYL